MGGRAGRQVRPAGQCGATGVLLSRVTSVAMWGDLKHKIYNRGKAGFCGMV